MRCVTAVVPDERQREVDSDMRLAASAVFLCLNEADGARDCEKWGSHRMGDGHLGWDTETRGLNI